MAPDPLLNGLMGHPMMYPTGNSQLYWAMREGGGG